MILVLFPRSWRLRTSSRTGCGASARQEDPADLAAADLYAYRVDVDALFLRSDGCVAWALVTGRDLDATTLVRVMGTWFGQPA